MSAKIIAYSADRYDTRLTIKVECLECGIEFGWSPDTPEANDRLEGMANWHNIEHHAATTGTPHL